MSWYIFLQLCYTQKQFIFVIAHFCIQLFIFLLDNIVSAFIYIIILFSYIHLTIL